MDTLRNQSGKGYSSVVLGWNYISTCWQWSYKSNHFHFKCCIMQSAVISYIWGLHIFPMKAWPHVFLMALTQVSLHGWLAPSGSKLTLFSHWPAQLLPHHLLSLKAVGAPLHWDRKEDPQRSCRDGRPRYKTHALNAPFKWRMTVSVGVTVMEAQERWREGGSPAATTHAPSRTSGTGLGQA